MTSLLRVPFAAAIVAGVVMMSHLGAAQAQASRTNPASVFEPVATPAIDPGMLQIPAAKSDADRLKLDRSDKAVAPIAVPKGIELGKYELGIDAKRTKDVTAPGVPIDSGETANLSKIAPGQKVDHLLPNYFGLKLSAPTH